MISNDEERKLRCDFISTFKNNDKVLYREFQSPFLLKEKKENQLTLDCSVMYYDLHFGKDVVRSQK